MTDKTGPSKFSAETDETAAAETENDHYRDRRIAHNLPSTRPTQRTAATPRSAPIHRQFALVRFQMSFITRVLNKIYTNFVCFKSTSSAIKSMKLSCILICKNIITGGLERGSRIFVDYRRRGVGPNPRRACAAKYYNKNYNILFISIHIYIYVYFHMHITRRSKYYHIMYVRSKVSDDDILYDSENR